MVFAISYKKCGLAKCWSDIMDNENYIHFGGFLFHLLLFRPNSIIIGRNNENWTKGDFMRKFDYSKLAE